jgi:hypothetical protein
MEELSHMELYKFKHNNIPVYVAKRKDAPEGLEIWCKPFGFYSVRNGVVKPFDDNCKHVSESDFHMTLTFAMKSIVDVMGFNLSDF